MIIKLNAISKCKFIAYHELVVFFHTPLLHLLLHVDALFVQQLPLSEGPVDRFNRRLGTRRPLSLQTSLLWVIEAKHVAFSHDDAVP